VPTEGLQRSPWLGLPTCATCERSLAGLSFVLSGDSALNLHKRDPRLAVRR